MKLHRTATLLGGLAALVLLTAACSTAEPSVTVGPTFQITPEPSPSPAVPTGTAQTQAIEGFAFAADDVVGYYQTLGYQCTAVQPSATAAGFFVRTCELLDSAGRTRNVGVVTDPAGRVANGFASIAGTSTETVLDPGAALEPLGAFLGAMLGEEQGGALVPWLAAHLGDAYAQTTLGTITVATYTDAADVHSRLYLELGNDEYLAAPGAPTPGTPTP